MVIGFQLLMLVLSCVANATSLESNYLHSLVHARKVPDVARLRSDYEELKIARGTCRIQLKERFVPSACYLVLHLEEKIESLSSTPSQNLARLDQLCREAAGNAVHVASGRQYLSRPCQGWVAEAALISKYREQGVRD